MRTATAKSIHAYVLGGTKDDVAQALFDSVAAGIETVGEQVVTITDASGLDHAVKFDFAREVKIYLQLDLKTNASFPIDGVSQIKNNLVYKIGELMQTALTIPAHKWAMILYCRSCSTRYIK